MSEPMAIREAINFFSEWVGGEHYLPSTSKKNYGIEEFGNGYCIKTNIALSTYDSSRLTDLILLAFKYLYRVEIQPYSKHKLLIAVWKRKSEGSIWQRHPSLNDLHKQIERFKGKQNE